MAAGETCLFEADVQQVSAVVKVEPEMLRLKRNGSVVYWGVEFGSKGLPKQRCDNWAGAKRAKRTKGAMKVIEVG